VVQVMKTRAFVTDTPLAPLRLGRPLRPPCFGAPPQHSWGGKSLSLGMCEYDSHCVGGEGFPAPPAMCEYDRQPAPGARHAMVSRLSHGAHRISIFRAFSIGAEGSIPVSPCLTCPVRHGLCGAHA
jgi:hypothetical protein